MSYKSRRKMFIVLLPAFVWIVFVINCRPDSPRESWSKRWGPLVPHRTFPGDCGICHVTERWDVLRKDFSFNHEKEAGYPLEGAHAEAACLRCHNDRGPVSAYVSRGCGGCHPDPHASSLGLDCERCHGQNDWTPTGLIAEHARTRFHLVAAHAAAPCESCHLQAAVGQYKGAPVQCALCHQANLAQANSPDHIVNGWTTDCERCHTPAGWSGADFEHYFFPLTGGHTGLDCSKCHTGGTFQSIPSDCYSCHTTQYQLAPNHVDMNYPQNCERCHTTNAWKPASFRHTFPLEGQHNVSCELCHTAGNTSSFDCLSCHEKGETDAEHDDESGYSYSSTACYQCHPDGEH